MTDPQGATSVSAATTGYGHSSLRNYRFYIAVDVSGSMDDRDFYGGADQTPMGRLNTVLPELMIRLLREPLLLGRTWISVCTFNERFSVHLPSVRSDEFEEMDEVRAGGFTDFAELANGLCELIDHDNRTLPIEPGRHWFKPAVFVLSDGIPSTDGVTRQPDDAWRPAHARLVRDYDANIVALGIGHVTDEVLCALATRNAQGQPLAFADEGTMNGGQLVESIKTALLRSILRSAETGDLDVPLPRGMRRVECAAEPSG